jgi:colanic acid/amylovoran biosynthesis glycosyltransferase
MQITYLINQYPKVSHSFIRREMMALEKQGFMVQRIAQRGWNDALVDLEDKQERAKTQYIVQQGAIALLFSLIKIAFRHPIGLFDALKRMCQLFKHSDKSFFLHLIYLLEACQLALWMQTVKSQHLHAHFGTNSAEIAMLASAISQIPYSFTVHGPEEFDKPITLNLRTKIQFTKFVVAVSSFGRSQLYRWADYADWHKIKVVHCGLESAFYAVPQQMLTDSPRVVCVGRLCEQKGQLLLVQAAKQLLDDGVDFQLVLAGDGEMRPEIERLIHQNGLQHHITITGWISSAEVRQYLLDAKALVLPSFAEGLPVVIMEAMSLRRPVISTYIAGIPELVLNGTNGFLCSAGDVDSLAKTIHKLLNTDQDTLQQMGDSAFERVVARHQIDTEAAKLAVHIKA